jgi:hypothetical protein
MACQRSYISVGDQVLLDANITCLNCKQYTVFTNVLTIYQGHNENNCHVFTLVDNVKSNCCNGTLTDIFEPCGYLDLTDSLFSNVQARITV